VKGVASKKFRGGVRVRKIPLQAGGFALEMFPLMQVIFSDGSGILPWEWFFALQSVFPCSDKGVLIIKSFSPEGEGFFYHSEKPHR